MFFAINKMTYAHSKRYEYATYRRQHGIDHINGWVLLIKQFNGARVSGDNGYFSRGEHISIEYLQDVQGVQEREK